MEEPPKHPAVAALFSQLLTATGLNAAGLAKKLDITPQAISNYVVGRNEPGRKMMAAIIKAFPAINAVWLATGEGEPFPNGVHGRPAVSMRLTEASVAEESSAKFTPTMTVLDNLEEMTPEGQIAYWKARAEVAEDELAAELAAKRETERHEKAVKLVRTAGGRFNSASPDAAEDDYTPPAMVAETNHEYVEAEEQTRRVGFKYGVSLC